jgi:redox-regulated HSP33 family molecular chaperone
LLSGIVDTDTFDLPVEFPGWIVNDHIIKAGDPLMQVIPFKRDKWQMSIEHTETHTPAMTEELRYKDLFHKKKKFN